MSKPLVMLANRYGTDKHWLHGYIPHYVRHFEPLREKKVRLLEIGIGGYNVPGRGGHSLRMWGEYFANGEITGIDIEDKSFVDRCNIKTFICDQTDEAALAELSKDRGPFDIIIDDGSHQQPHVLKSFYALFPLLAAGGIYVIEDLECAYRTSHQGHPELQTPNGISLIQRLVDGLHWQFWGPRRTGPTVYDQHVDSIHVSKELVFIYKK